MTPEELDQDGISRRKMLKRIGAGAAVAWSAPILTSMRAPAFAQQDGECQSSACDPGSTCAQEDPCRGLENCEGRGDCACFRLMDLSDCRCGAFPSNFCADYPPCASDGDCPEGQCCYASCCPEGICRGPCGGGQKALGIKGGPTVTRG